MVVLHGGTPPNRVGLGRFLQTDLETPFRSHRIRELAVTKMTLCWQIAQRAILAMPQGHSLEVWCRISCTMTVEYLVDLLRTSVLFPVFDESRAQGVPGLLLRSLCAWLTPSAQAQSWSWNVTEERRAEGEGYRCTAAEAESGGLCYRVCFIAGLQSSSVSFCPAWTHCQWVLFRASKAI